MTQKIFLIHEILFYLKPMLSLEYQGVHWKNIVYWRANLSLFFYWLKGSETLNDFFIMLWISWKCTKLYASIDEKLVFCFFPWTRYNLWRKQLNILVNTSALYLQKFYVTSLEFMRCLISYYNNYSAQIITSIGCSLVIL